MSAHVVRPAVFHAVGIYGFIRASIFGLIMGTTQYLFLRKTRLAGPGWILWIGLLFGLIGSLNSVLFTYLDCLHSSPYYPWGSNWIRSIHPWMVLIGAIAGLIYGPGTGGY